MLYKLPGLVGYLWFKIICDLQEKMKNENILVLISLKRYFAHPEK